MLEYACVCNISRSLLHKTGTLCTYGLIYCTLLIRKREADTVLSILEGHRAWLLVVGGQGPFPGMGEGWALPHCLCRQNCCYDKEEGHGPSRPCRLVKYLTFWEPSTARTSLRKLDTSALPRTPSDQQKRLDDVGERKHTEHDRSRPTRFQSACPGDGCSTGQPWRTPAAPPWHCCIWGWGGVGWKQSLGGALAQLARGISEGSEILISHRNRCSPSQRHWATCFREETVPFLQRDGRPGTHAASTAGAVPQWE